MCRDDNTLLTYFPWRLSSSLWIHLRSFCLYEAGTLRFLVVFFYDHLYAREICPISRGHLTLRCGLRVTNWHSRVLTSEPLSCSGSSVSWRWLHAPPPLSAASNRQPPEHVITSLIFHAERPYNALILASQSMRAFHVVPKPKLATGQ